MVMWYSRLGDVQSVQKLWLGEGLHPETSRLGGYVALKLACTRFGCGLQLCPGPVLATPR